MLSKRLIRHNNHYFKPDDVARCLLKLILFLVLASGARSACADEVKGIVMRSITMDQPSSRIVEVGPKMTEHNVGPEIIESINAAPVSTTFDPETIFSLKRSDDGYRRGHALEFAIDREQRSPTSPQKSKIEMNVVRTDDVNLDKRFDHRFILREGADGYLSFMFKMDSARYETPLKWVLHMQVVQCCENEDPDPKWRTQPPLVWQVEPSLNAGPDKVAFVVIKRDDKFVGGEASHDHGEKLIFNDGRNFMALTKGVWHSIVFHLRPRPAPGTDGEVELWVDGVEDLKFVGCWGYSKQIMGPTPSYGLKLGIYRAAQNAEQRVLFDDVRWGTTLESVKISGQDTSN